MRVRRAVEVLAFAPLGALATFAARVAGRIADHDDAPEPVAPPEPAPAASAPAPPVGALAIEGYDHLAARQVIDRLDGLTPGELADVEAYERANRHRQVVLGRLAQLQS